MLLILWGILKAIGIVLLFLILLFILVIFLILSVPVRYKINFKYTDRADCYICVSWLVHFIHIEYSTADGAVFKVCGIGILKRKNKSFISDRDKTNKSDKAVKTNEDSRILTSSTLEKTENNKCVLEKNKADKKVIREKQIKKKIPGSKRISLFYKIKYIFSPSRIYRKLKNRLTALYKKVKKQLIRLANGSKKAKKKFLRLLSDKSLRRAVKKIFNGFLKISAHCLPISINGYIKFGTGDPYSTGNILRYTALCIPLYKNKFDVIPVFDESIIETDTRLKGRVSIRVILGVISRLYFDRDVKKLLKKFL
ncbi:hypothetical protein [Johnsonella ignava]|uniref:hypothetical protein n=1 Tax=Johnsonella ignava TaxID=43995 RepID=UPI0023F3E3AC|nr:hypothetical protein [Johnsonella ignava]